VQLVVALSTQQTYFTVLAYEAVKQSIILAAYIRVSARVCVSAQ